MKKLRENAYEVFLSERSAEDTERLERFFRAFEEHCLLRSAEKLKLRADFEKAILCYHQAGKTVEEMLGRLSIRKMGGFYARPASAWFPLDDAAKIYPLSMGHNSMSVFRLSAYLKTQVVPELLQVALDFTITRFPSFATTLKKGFFWHYLDSSKRRFSAEPDYAVPCRALAVSRSGSQSFRVLYFQNRISVEFFHVLTDGTGGMEFLKALTAEYLRLTGVAIPKENLMDPEDLPDPEEIENAFAKVDRSGAGSGFVDKMAVQMSGRLSDIKPCRVIHLKMSADAIKAAAKKYQATVTAYLLGVMFLAQRAATEQMQGDVSIQVPVNMRKFYPSRTVRNFALYCGIRMPLQDLRSLEEIVPLIRDQLTEKASQESMRRMLASTEKLVRSMQYIPLALKQPAARLVYGFLGDKIFSNTLSNLGVVKIPEAMAQQIESMDFVLGTTITNRAGCSAVTVNGVTTFSIAKTTADPTFEEMMWELLRRDGILVEVEGSECYGS